MRIRPMALPGTPNADGVQPYLLIVDDSRTEVTEDELAQLNLPDARRQFGGCQGAYAIGWRVELEGEDADRAELVDQGTRLLAALHHLAANSHPCVWAETGIHGRGVSETEILMALGPELSEALDRMKP